MLRAISVQGARSPIFFHRICSLLVSVVAIGLTTPAIAATTPPSPTKHVYDVSSRCPATRMPLQAGTPLLRPHAARASRSPLQLRGEAAVVRAAKGGGWRARLADETGEFDPLRMLGARGTRTTSTTLARGRGYRIDVENPAPGRRPGRLHLQDESGGKYLYDFEAGEFRGLPRSLARQIENDPAVAHAIAKGRRYLGLDE